jgi:hypothetical protein
MNNARRFPNPVCSEDTRDLTRPGLRPEPRLGRSRWPQRPAPLPRPSTLLRATLSLPKGRSCAVRAWTVLRQTRTKFSEGAAKRSGAER